MGKSSAEQTTAMAALTSAEPRPLSEPAKATMQTSSGARSETSIKCRSTKMAIKAVAAVRAGPEIARQLSCMPVLVCPRVKVRSLAYDCNSGEFSFAVLNRRSTEPARLYALLDQMITMADGTGLRTQISALKFRTKI